MPVKLELIDFDTLKIDRHGEHVLQVTLDRP